MKPPLDTNRFIPDVPKRESAAARLLELLPAELADAVWDEIIGPLYDSRTMRADWRRGDCIRCSTPHPALWAGTRAARDGKPWPGHRQDCPKYVGPLVHRAVRGHQALMGWMNDCACGRAYPDDAWAWPPVQCPDAALDWRGLRPETETT